MKSEYANWLIEQDYASNTQTAQLHRVQKVEEHYGPLDDIIAKGELGSLVQELTYSASDERMAKPNPSRIPIGGNFRKGLQSYKNAIQRYAKFLREVDREIPNQGRSLGIAKAQETQSEAKLEDGQKFALERDMQRMLRGNIEQLSSDLRIVDDGAERSVESGFIDILCEDATGAQVVIELKAGKTDSRVVGQILGYMGDLVAEGEGDSVRGIIVAHSFDKRTLSAARAIPNLKLLTYSIAFSFEALT